MFVYAPLDLSIGVTKIVIVLDGLEPFSVSAFEERLWDLDWTQSAHAFLLLSSL